MTDSRAKSATIISGLLNHQGSLAALNDLVRNEDESQHAWIRALCYGVCRWWWAYEPLLREWLDKPLKPKDQDIKALLMIGVHQLYHMNKPPHAVINETVQATYTLNKSWASKLVNAVLRRLDREHSYVANIIESHSAHPGWIEKRLKKAYGDQAASIFLANNQHPPMTLRVNQQCISRTDYLKQLAGEGIDARPGTVTTDSIYLERAVAVSDLPNFQQGWVSVQDESPQITPSLMKLAKGLHVLDACSAPGGKTGHLLECEPSLSVVALDVSERRLARVGNNLARLKVSAELKAADAQQPSTWWDGKPFDRILLDTPCSALGILRRQPDVKLLRRALDMPALVATQYALLNALWPLLAPGGRLVYATCSVLPEENSQVIAAFINDTADAEHSVINASWGHAQEFGRQILPAEGEGDGFYYACLDKTHIL